jgi:hypothetical protein
MLANRQTLAAGNPALEQQWREALIAAWHAQREYEEIADMPDADDAAVDRLWLRLWRAERVRDELLQAMD